MTNHGGYYALQLRINRYMLGCKFVICSHGLFTKLRINRYMLGCKLLSQSFSLSALRELIDTCWDVNDVYIFKCNHWLPGINRYMLGCKWRRQDNICYRLRQELIDTCWDVNLYTDVCKRLQESELIDTCWDVN